MSYLQEFWRLLGDTREGGFHFLVIALVTVVGISIGLVLGNQ